jgi:AraC-like DNA-binding protein
LAQVVQHSCIKGSLAGLLSVMGRSNTVFLRHEGRLLPSLSFPRELVLQTRDLDEAARELGSTAIPYVSELLPGSPPFSTQIRSAQGELVRVSWVVTTGAMRVKARLPVDAFAIVLDLRAGVGLHRGEDESVVVNSEFSFVQSPLQSVEVLTTADFDALFLRLARAGVVRELQKMLGREIHAEVVFSPGFRMQSTAGQNLRDLAGGLCRLMGTMDDRRASQSLPVQTLEASVISLLLQAQPHNYTRLLNRQSGAGDRQLRVAEEYLRANAHLPLTLGDICLATGVNARTLQSSFHKKHSCSPMQFLRQVRMQEVRAGLLHPHENATVTSEASRWGFVHFGRFSREYQRAFGELPSQTLRRSRGLSGLCGC